MMNKRVQEDILEIVKNAKDELKGSPTVNDFYEEALNILLTSDNWHMARNEIEGRANTLTIARRRKDAEIRAKKES